jgi:hypothetical protein
VGEIKPDWLFLRFWARQVGEIKKTGGVGFSGSISSLTGADKSVEERLPIKGTMLGRQVGMARSSTIGTR